MGVLARSPEFGIIDLLKPFGFDDHLKTKLVRHRDRRVGIESLIQTGWFDLYQSLQSDPVFRNCDRIISFIGDGGGRARLIGVYRVIKENDASPSHVPMDCPFPEWSKANYHYELERLPEYAALEGRVVIGWSSEISWHQHLKNYSVIEIAPTGRCLPPFNDYLDFSLSHGQLKDLIVNESAHKDWAASLSCVAGVYLVLAESNGSQYVGAAYGSDGIWGRWAQYAKTGHGGNVKLQTLLKQDKAYPAAFRYSVLQVLPKSTAATEVIRWESVFKEKLGSRSMGLNS